MTQQCNTEYQKPLIERTSLSDIFLAHNLDKNVRIIDVACGIGIVAEEIGKFGYRNVDGLDPSKGYLTVAQERGIYKVWLGNY